jgi:hypothetical protein
LAEIAHRSSLIDLGSFTAYRAVKVTLFISIHPNTAEQMLQLNHVDSHLE